MKYYIGSTSKITKKNTLENYFSNTVFIEIKAQNMQNLPFFDKNLCNLCYFDYNLLYFVILFDFFGTNKKKKNSQNCEFFLLNTFNPRSSSFVLTMFIIFPQLLN